MLRPLHAAPLGLRACEDLFLFYKHLALNGAWSEVVAC